METKHVGKAVCALFGALGIAWFAGYKVGEKYGAACTMTALQKILIDVLAKNDDEKKEEAKEQEEA